MRQVLFIFFAMFFVLLCIGYAVTRPNQLVQAKHPLVGVWRMYDDNVPCTMSFRSDGTGDTTCGNGHHWNFSWFEEGGWLLYNDAPLGPEKKRVRWRITEDRQSLIFSQHSGYGKDEEVVWRRQ